VLSRGTTELLLSGNLVSGIQIASRVPVEVRDRR
jgi:hypothetical protein